MPTAPKLDYHIQPSTIGNGFTQSELSLLDECPKKWNLKYNNQLDRADTFSWALYVGSAWHAFQEHWRRQKGNIDLTATIDPVSMLAKGMPQDSDFEQWREYWMKVLPAYQIAYAKIYKDEEKHDWFLVEEELAFEHLGYNIRGKVDLASSKPRFIRDFKSTVSAWLTSPNGWHFKLQFMTYCWLMVKNYPEFGLTPFDFQLDMMQKPGLKQTKADGTWQGHIRRVCEDVKTRASDFYLSRQSYKITPDAIARFEVEVLTPKIQRIALAVENPEDGLSIITNPNTNACNMFGHQCEFFEVCEKGWDAGKFFFTRRENKHNELA